MAYFSQEERLRESSFPWKQLHVFGTCSRVLTLIVIVSAWVAVLPARLGSEEVSPTGMVIRVAGGEIHLILPDERLKISSPDLLEWVRSAAGAVVHYYGHF